MTLLIGARRAWGRASDRRSPSCSGSPWLDVASVQSAGSGIIPPKAAPTNHVPPSPCVSVRVTSRRRVAVA
jgi:hypothetical protein